jgi:hypothetical protein
MPLTRIQSLGITDGTIVNADINASAAIANTKLSAGTVLQVVQGLTTTAVSTTLNTYVTTGLSASITPSSASNKVLIIANTDVVQNISTDVDTTIFRGTVAGTNLSTSGLMARKYNTQANEPSSVTNVYLDSPSTTSSQTYTLGFRSTAATYTSTVNVSSCQATIILMEIAG